MQEIILFNKHVKSYYDLKKELLEIFKKQKVEKEFNFENYYSFVELEAGSYMACVITRDLGKKLGCDLAYLIMFVNDLANEGINTFVSYSKGQETFNLYFSKYFGQEDEDLFNDDNKFLENNNINYIDLTERLFGCYSDNKFIIKDVERITEKSFSNDENYEPEYYEDFITKNTSA